MMPDLWLIKAAGMQGSGWRGSCGRARGAAQRGGGRGCQGHVLGAPPKTGGALEATEGQGPLQEPGTRNPGTRLGCQDQRLEGVVVNDGGHRPGALGVRHLRPRGARERARLNLIASAAWLEWQQASMRQRHGRPAPP